MVIYFWNIQRVSNPNPRTFDAGLRWGVAMQNIDTWLRNGSFDVLVLAEVTQTGGAFANYLNNYIALHHIPGYSAEFVPVPGERVETSPCSFAVVKRIPANVVPTGATVRRPLIKIRVQGYEIGACHIISSNRVAALDEMFGMCAELQNRQPGILIGDMNYPFNDYDRQEINSFRNLGWAKVNPGMQATHRGHSLLDYAWRNTGIGNIAARVPVPGYNLWEMIDHAPVGYVI